jgi:hypothetical protein
MVFPPAFIRSLVEICDEAIEAMRRVKNYERADYFRHVRGQLADIYASTGGRG